ncbi:MAG: permease [Candidatus Hadarchaeales archaeon]
MPRKKTVLAILAWGFLFFGLFTIVYSRVTGHPLFPVYNYGDLKSYNPILIPFVYIASYITRVWGPFLFAFTLAGVIESFVSREKMNKYLSSMSMRSYVLAALLASVLVVCSCAMIPVFAGIMMAGAGIGPAISFLLMAPAANFIGIVFTSELISPVLAGARYVSAFFGAVLIGFVVAKTPWGKAVGEKFSKISIAKAAGMVKMDFWEKSANSLKEAYTLVRMVLPYLLLGIAAVSFIDAYLPTTVVATCFTGVLGVFLGAIIGVPFYTPTLVEVFLVKTLINAGMAPAAALAFMLGGPMTSIPSMLGVSKVIGRKTVLTYALLAVVWAFVAGSLYMIFIGGL